MLPRLTPTKHQVKVLDVHAYQPIMVALRCRYAGKTFETAFAVAYPRNGHPGRFCASFDAHAELDLVGARVIATDWGFDRRLTFPLPRHVFPGNAFDLNYTLTTVFLEP